MTTIQTIPFNQLVQSKANVRRTGRTVALAELVASIAAHGLRQNLNVRPITGGRYEVAAGGRRLRALRLLAKEGRLASDAPIPCMVLAEGDDPSEISLVENAQREPMHPDDQCDAFRRLIDHGAGIEDVAARFGITPTVVRQRLKLANVSPRLRALYRKGEMTLDHMMALAISDDHAAQEQAWQNLPDWNRSPYLLKDALTHEAVAVTDKLARLIGVEAYEAAGGTVIRDLFDEDDAGYLADRALVLRLASEKMAETVSVVQAEGWKWVTPEMTRDYDTRYGRVYPQPDTDSDSLAYAAEDLARAGARVLLEHDGSLRVERGLIHPDDLPREPKAGHETPRSPTALPATMVAELTAHRTAALRIELARNPAVALAATVHALAFAQLYAAGPLPASCLALRADSAALERHAKVPEDGPAHLAMDTLAVAWMERLPESPDTLFAWCLDQPQDVLLELLAFLAALSVDAVQEKHDRRDNDRLTHADRLAEALTLDMAQWWRPSVDGFYGRLSRALLASFVADAGLHAPIARPSLKKQEVAERVAKTLDGSGWLPEPLRSPEVAPPAAADAA